MFLFAKQANPNQSNRRSMVQRYFPLLVFPGCDYQTTILPCFAIHIFVLVILAKWGRHIHPIDTQPKDTRRTGKIDILLNDTIQPVRWVSL
jgi:hypothetical protein